MCYLTVHNCWKDELRGTIYNPTTLYSESYIIVGCLLKWYAQCNWFYTLNIPVSISSTNEARSMHVFLSCALFNKITGVRTLLPFPTSGVLNIVGKWTRVKRERFLAYKSCHNNSSGFPFILSKKVSQYARVNVNWFLQVELIPVLYSFINCYQRHNPSAFG